jgi:hypothetical protein
LAIGEALGCQFSEQIVVGYFDRSERFLGADFFFDLSHPNRAQVALTLTLGSGKPDALVRKAKVECV